MINVDGWKTKLHALLISLNRKHCRFWDHSHTFFRRRPTAQGMLTLKMTVMRCECTFVVWQCDGIKTQDSNYIRRWDTIQIFIKQREYKKVRCRTKLWVGWKGYFCVIYASNFLRRTKQFCCFSIARSLGQLCMIFFPLSCCYAGMMNPLKRLIHQLLVIDKLLCQYGSQFCDIKPIYFEMRFFRLPTRFCMWFVFDYMGSCGEELKKNTKVNVGNSIFQFCVYISHGRLVNDPMNQ